MLAYLTTLITMTDEWLNALFGGEGNQTISMDTALAAKDGQLGACLLCRWFHLTMRQNHCQRTLAGEPVTGFALVSAGVQLTIAFLVVVYGVPWLAYHLYLLTFNPDASAAAQGFIWTVN